MLLYIYYLYNYIIRRSFNVYFKPKNKGKHPSKHVVSSLKARTFLKKHPSKHVVSSLKARTFLKKHPSKHVVSSLYFKPF